MITYNTDGVKFPNIKKRETSNWIHKVAESYGKKVGEIGYMFVNDEKYWKSITNISATTITPTSSPSIIQKAKFLMVILSSLSTPSSLMPTNSVAHMMKNFTVSSFMEFSIFVVSMTKGQENAKSWRLQKKRRWQ